MENLSDISVIRRVMEKHGFNFSKALGQNFLINPTVCPRMAEMCGADENTGVIEVGAGVGVLVLFRTNRPWKQNVKIVGLLYAIGVAAGLLIDLIGITF